MISKQTVWGKKGIWAKMNDFQEGGSLEWTYNIIIYLGKERIGQMNENTCGLVIQGHFDYKVVEKDTGDDLGAELEDNTLEFSIADLQKLMLIAQYNEGSILGSSQLDDIWEPYIEEK